MKTIYIVSISFPNIENRKDTHRYVNINVYTSLWKAFKFIRSVSAQCGGKLEYEKSCLPKDILKKLISGDNPIANVPVVNFIQNQLNEDTIKYIGADKRYYSITAFKIEN